MIFLASMKWITTFLILFTPYIDELNMELVCIDMYDTDEYMCSLEPCDDFGIGCGEYIIGFVNGIDDFGMWEKFRNSSEILELYNSGMGNPYGSIK